MNQMSIREVIFWVFLFGVVLFMAPRSFAHEVKPAPREESCAAAKWLGAAIDAMDPSTDGARMLRTKALAVQASDECKEYRARAINCKAVWKSGNGLTYEICEDAE